MSIPGDAAGRLARLIGRFAFQSARCLHGMTADEVHDVRVAVRRLDEALKLFAEWVPGKQCRKIRERLRAVLKAAGAVRDLDIGKELLKDLALPVDAAIVAALEERRQTEAAYLAAMLKRLVDSGFSEKWRDRLELESADGASKGQLADLAKSVLPDRAAEFIEAGERLARHPKRKRVLHSFRISAKRLRYSLEPFADVYGPALKKRLHTIREVQNVLGRLNDCAATRALLKDFAGTGGARDALRDEQAKRLNEFQQRWPALFEAGAAKKWRRFLTEAPAPVKSGRAPARKRTPQARPAK